MESILITPSNQDEFSLITHLLERMKIKSKVLSLEEKEDYGLSILMSKADREKKVSRDSIMKKLKN
jgi:hypothetical protein